MIHLLITVVFSINDFAWTKGESKMMPPLTIVKGMVLDFNLHFRVACGYVFQSC